MQGCANWGAWGVSRPPIFSNLQESWPKGSHAGRELATVFPVTFLNIFSNNSWLVGQNVPPLQQKVSRYITGPMSFLDSIIFYLPRYELGGKWKIRTSQATWTNIEEWKRVMYVIYYSVDNSENHTLDFVFWLIILIIKQRCFKARW